MFLPLHWCAPYYPEMIVLRGKETSLLGMMPIGQTKYTLRDTATTGLCPAPVYSDDVNSG